MTNPLSALRYRGSETMVAVGPDARPGATVSIEEADGTITSAILTRFTRACVTRTPANWDDQRRYLWGTRRIPLDDPALDHVYPLPGAEVVIFRTRMAGGGLSYKGEVPIEHVFMPDDPPYPMTEILHYDDGNERLRRFLSFDDATLPRDVQRMAPGWDKYDANEAHRARASKRLHALACTVFPELRQLTEMPFLWVHGLVPEVEESHAERHVVFVPAAKAA